MKVTLAALAAVLMVMPAVPALEGPWIGVTSPEDGEVLTDHQITVVGNATPPVRGLVVEGEDLSHGERSNLELVNDNLTFKATRVFEDKFEGSALDDEAWDILIDPANVSVGGGMLKLTYTQSWPVQQESLPQVISKAFEVPEGSDIEAGWRMRYSSYGYSGSGGGISRGHTDPYRSHLAVYQYWKQWPTPFHRVWANGEPVYNQSTYDLEFHEYALEYSALRDRYTCHRDEDTLHRYQVGKTPTTFWFGAGEKAAWPTAASIEVDHVSIWATSGMWTSGVFDVEHGVAIEGARATWNSTHPQAARVVLEIRVTEDGKNWTAWLPLDERNLLETPVNGTQFQLRARLGMPGHRRASANITLSSVELRYRDPITSVEVRREGGDWVMADGLEEWSADLVLEEDGNTIQVRVTDTGGAVNTTSREVIVDTTAPVGTVEIEGDRVYTNDLNVTLLLNASDRWGVELIEVSNWPDFSRKSTFPYQTWLDWRINGAEGENRVYVRFIDTHGLVSLVVSDSVIFDNFLPLGSLEVDGGRLYTSDRTVQLELSYSDNNGVRRVELSNDPVFPDPWEVPTGATTVSDWKLGEGGDGVRTVYLRVTDVAGNVHVVSDDIELYIPKAIGSVTINEGDALTGQTAVRLDIEVPFAERVRLMQISNGPDFSGAKWQTVGKRLTWMLEPVDGVRTVHVRFLDFRDIVSVPVNDSIRLDITAPRVNVTLDGGTMYTTDTVVRVRVDYHDASDPVTMWPSPENSFERIKPQDFEAGFNWTIPSRESDHMLFVQVEDAAGNRGVGSALIHYATIRPVIMLSLPEGDVLSTKDTIPLNVTPVDPYGGIVVQVVFDGQPSGEDPWVALDGTLQVAVPPGTEDGRHRIRARARNAAGLVSDVEEVVVVLDTVAPTLSILYPEDGAKVLQKGLVVRLEVAAADSHRLDSIVYAVDGGDQRELSMDLPTANITLDGFGDHTIEVVAEDTAGNVARGTSSFSLEEAEDPRALPLNWMTLLVLVLLAAAGVAAYGLHRSRSPGLRTVRLEPGDGWDEEYTHPTLEAAVAAGEAGLEDVDVPEGEEVEAPPPEEEPEPPTEERAMELEHVELEQVELEQVELEQVELPPDLEAEGDEWSEF